MKKPDCIIMAGMKVKKQKWADPVTGKSPSFWGRSIGWYMMALVDVLDNFPEDHKNRNDLIKMLQNVSESLLKYRDEKTKLMVPGY